MYKPMFASSIVAVAVAIALSQSAAAGDDQAWIERSNTFTHMLVDVELEHSPEQGSAEGLSQFDSRISDPSLTDQLAERRELEAAVEKIRSAQPGEIDPRVQQDMQILFKAMDLQFRRQDFELASKVPFYNASERVFEGLHVLLDDQVATERRAAALTRLRKYAGLDCKCLPYAELLRQRTQEQMAKPGAIFASREELQTELGRNVNYVDGIPELFKKYRLSGWEGAYQKLKGQLASYDAWVRMAVLPKARADFRLPSEEYALALESYGIDVPATQLAAMAHGAFAEYQTEMAPLAAEVAKRRGLAANDYRSVIRQLKKQQITGSAILPLYEARLHSIEAVIAAQKLVSLPDRPAIIRLATAAETAQVPAPHMKPPPFLHNTGQRGEFILPLNIPAASGEAADQFDDFTAEAASWTMIAHEARPGHELQFDSMVENGVSLARILYAFNSTNVEGWGLYSEYLMQPYEPVEGQLFTLQFRLQRAARAFLDPELQSGKITVAQAYDVMEQDVILSHALAKEEIERFTFRAPGQANSYFYGYSRLLELRKEAEAALGAKFNPKKFHDFLLEQGLLPPELMRKAVLENFVVSQL